MRWLVRFDRLVERVLRSADTIFASCSSFPIIDATDWAFVEDEDDLLLLVECPRRLVDDARILLLDSSPPSIKDVEEDFLDLVLLPVVERDLPRLLLFFFFSSAAT